jgi:hypothetical protein
MSDKDRVYDLIRICADQDTSTEDRKKFYLQALEIVRNPTRPVKRTYPVQFESFWQAYPLNTGKAKAEKAYTKALKSVPHEVIMKGLQFYIKTKPDYQAFAHAATWLNDERYLDAPDESRPIVRNDWPDWKNKLADKMGQAPVLSWFKDVEFAQGVFTVPNQITYNWIKDRMAKDVYEVLGQFELTIKEKIDVR